MSPVPAAGDLSDVRVFWSYEKSSDSYRTPGMTESLSLMAMRSSKYSDQASVS